MQRTTKLNSIGESMEKCRKALLICEALELQPDAVGRETLVTSPEGKDMTQGGEPPAEVCGQAALGSGDNTNEADTGDGRFHFVADRVWEDADGNETDREETDRQSFETAEEANAHIKKYYNPVEWDDEHCLSEPRTETDGTSSHIDVRTMGFSYEPPEETSDDGDDGLSDKAREILERDSEHLHNFLGDIDQDEQYVFKNGLFVVSDYGRSGLLGQANFIALLKMLEDKGIKPEDDNYGVLSVRHPRMYYFWYNPKNVELVNAIAEAEAACEDYPCLDDMLYSEMESLAADLYWYDAMDDREKIAYYRKHNEEIDPEWESEDFDGDIPKPESFNENGDITSYITGSTLSDQDLKGSDIEVPDIYFR